MNKVLITGAGGFVGQHLLEEIPAGKFDLRIITRHPDKKMRILPENCELVQADLKDAASLKNALKGIDTLINAAAEVRNTSKLTETNITGTKNLIDAIIENKVGNVIHLSSVGVVGMQYSSKQITVDENAACFPKNEYERTKLESERLLIDAAGKNNFCLTILRPTNVFGEHHPFNALLNLVQYVSSGKSFISSAQAMVNYVYVKDLASLMIQLIDDKNDHGILNVGEAQSLESFTRRVGKIMDRKVRNSTIPQILINFGDLSGIKKLQGVSNAVIYDDKKLKHFFNYPYGIETGLIRTINYYKQKQLLK